MAFPTGWGRKCLVTIQVAQVGGALTDFPVLFTEANLPSEMFDSDGGNSADNGGGDVRFSLNSDGTSQLPLEVVRFVTDPNPANGRAEIWVKAPSVSGVSNTPLYVWYKKPGEPADGASSTYGSQAVWDANYLAVLHLQNNVNVGATTPDSTAAGRNFTGVSGNITAIAGKISNGLDFNATRYLTKADENPALRPANLTLEAWIKADATSTFNVVAMKTNGSSWTLGWGLDFRSPNLRFWLNSYNSASSMVEVAPGTVNNRLIQAKYNGSQISMRMDGNSPTTISYSTAISYDGDAVHIGWHSGGSNFDGRVDEFRLSNTARSDAWTLTTWNSQNSPATFVVVGTPEDPAPPPPTDPDRSSLFPDGTGKASHVRILKGYRDEVTAKHFHNLMKEKTA